MNKLRQNSKSLAKEILDLPKSKHLSGWVPEYKSILKSLNFTNTLDTKVTSGLSKITWKSLVKEAIKENVVSKLKQELSSESKLKNGPMAKEDFEIKKYLDKMTLKKARINFKLR